jgi:muramoyltetrapeptide carboxypeptidase
MYCIVLIVRIYRPRPAVHLRLGLSSIAAGTDQERASDIMDFFNDPEVSLIVTTNGGCSSIRTLPFLDYYVLSNNPKPIVGYSYTTGLQLGIYAKTGITSITGFNCTDISSGTIENSMWQSVRNCINRQSYWINSGVTVCHGKVTAPLVGGNLTCLLNLMGSEYQPDFVGKILLVEDVGIEPYLIEGMFSQLWVSGILDAVAGIIIGQFTNCTAKHFDSGGISAQNIIDFWCSRIKVPCIKDFMYGHVEERFALPIGSIVTLNSTECTLLVELAK